MKQGLFQSPTTGQGSGINPLFHINQGRPREGKRLLSGRFRTVKQLLKLLLT